jgi:putative hydroxymethylpyrimidine transport system permease protein
MRGLIILCTLILLWQLLVTGFHLPPYILPSPLLTAKTIFTQFPLLLSQSIPTLVETLLGLGGALIFGCFTALLMAYIRSIKIWITPILLISQALPVFAVAPLFVIWLGYGLSAKIALTILMLYFPITSNFFDGLTHTPREFLDLAKIMQASRFHMLLWIRIPAALPHLASGLRIATASAPMGAMIGEWMGASKGLGFLMLNANGRMQIDMVFAALFMLIFWNLLLYFTVDHFLKKHVDNLFSRGKKR